MQKRQATLTNVVCMLGIVVFIAVLAIVPDRLKTASHDFNAPNAVKRTPQTINIEKKLDQIYPAPKGRAVKVLKKASLKDFLKYRESVIVNLWASWCPPCIDELPSIEFVSRQLKAQKESKLPLFITVSVDEGTTEIEQLFRTLEFNPSFVVLHDPSGDFARALGTTRFPETYWIAKNGEILHKWIGPQDWLSENVLRKISSVR